MNPVFRDNRREYLKTLDRLGPEGRVAKIEELTAYTRQMLRDALRDRFPDLPATDLHQLYLNRLRACHNRNY